MITVKFIAPNYDIDVVIRFDGTEQKGLEIYKKMDAIAKKTYGTPEGPFNFTFCEIVDLYPNVEFAYKIRSKYHAPCGCNNIYDYWAGFGPNKGAKKTDYKIVGGRKKPKIVKL